eukprot:bmy_11634T0
MEIDALKYDPSFEILALESYTDISATNKELLHLLDGNCSLSLNLNGRYQPSVESTKESQVICQPEMIAESPTGVKDVEKSRPKVLKHFTSCTYLRQRNFTQALRRCTQSDFRANYFLPSSCMWVKDLDQSPENPLTGLKPEKMSVLKLLSNLLPLIFPTADTAWILQPGFSLQEALEALHQVGRNADLPFLVLLAKNVVVPMRP